MGLSALWSSPAKGANDVITSFCNMDNTDHVLGLIYVGNAKKEAPTAERPAAQVTYLD
jgi:nitroreductase